MTDLAIPDFLKPTLLPLELLGVADRNVPGKERIYMRTHAQVRLNQYILLAGARMPDGTMWPFNDHLLWLGNQIIDAGFWILVYTGIGVAPIFTKELNTGEPAYVQHWGRSTTLFTLDIVVPGLLRVGDSVQVGQAGK